MDKKAAAALLKRYLEGKSTAEEQSLLESWYLKYEHKDLPVISEAEIDLRLAKIRAALPVTKLSETASKDTLLTAIRPAVTKHPVARRVMLWRGVAAACMVVLSVGTYLILSDQSFSGHANQATGIHEILPGGNKAVLKMANGEQVDLSGDKNGIIANGTQVVYADGSKVSGIEPGKSTVQNLNLSTPNGGQYQIVLSDGTKVWLNSASSLTYPSKFEGKERLVKITGEAYFEVAHLKSKPFRVESRGQIIEVLGTHFNVDAYADEKFTKTTLLQGKVKVITPQVSSNNSSDGQTDNAVGLSKNTKTTETLLRPGQQLQLSAKERKLISNPDLEEITAWKDGYFKFSESLESILTKVARWYDIEVVYEGNFDGKLKFLGKISRSKNLSSILDIISSASDVHFKVEGRRVTVMK